METYAKYLKRLVDNGAILKEKGLYRRNTDHFLYLPSAGHVLLSTRAWVESSTASKHNVPMLWNRDTAPIRSEQTGSESLVTLPTLYKNISGKTVENEEGLADLVEWGFNNLLVQYRAFLETLATQKSKADAQELTNLFFEALSFSLLADITEQIWRSKVSGQMIHDTLRSPAPGTIGEMILTLERAGGPGVRAKMEARSRGR